jgi:hypothetical protein
VTSEVICCSLVTSEVICCIVVSALTLACSARGRSRAGSASSRPSANSGIRHSGGTRPSTPLSRIMVPMVTRTSRRALVNSSKASGSSTPRAVIRLMVKPCEPQDRARSNQASQTSSVPVTFIMTMRTWRWFQAAQAVAAKPASSATSSPTQTPFQSCEV